MPRDGTITRNRIMDVAQQMVLNVGLSSTSVEKVIDRAGVTKGTFFYHFKTKRDPAAALIERDADQRSSSVPRLRRSLRPSVRRPMRISSTASRCSRWPRAV